MRPQNERAYWVQTYTGHCEEMVWELLRLRAAVLHDSWLGHALHRLLEALR